MGKAIHPLPGTDEVMLVLRDRGGRFSALVPVRGLAISLLMLAALLLLIVYAVSHGSYPIPAAEVLTALTGGMLSDPQTALIVREFRLPRILAAALAGALFAVAGACLQAATRNPLADPSLVGVSQGAAVAVLTVIIAVPGAAGLAPLVAVLGSFTVAGLMYALAGRDGAATIRFILTGVGIGAFLTAISSLLITYGELERVMAALVWLAGSVNAADWGDVGALAGWALLTLPAALALSRGLNALRLGEDVAERGDVPLRRTRALVIAVAVSAAAGAVATVGILGFVGLVAPHVARLLVGERQGMLMVICALTGALLVAAADLIGRLAFAPVQIPAGIVTALIGVPYFVALLWRRRDSL